MAWTSRPLELAIVPSTGSVSISVSSLAGDGSGEAGSAKTCKKGAGGDRAPEGSLAAAAQRERDELDEEEREVLGDAGAAGCPVRLLRRSATLSASRSIILMLSF